LDNVCPAALPLLVNFPAAHAPSILRAPAMQVRAVPERPERGPVLALAQDLARPVPALGHVQAPAERLRPLVKLRARSAPPHAAAAEGSNSIPRPKKAR